MRFDTIEKLLISCLELALSGQTGCYIDNPAASLAQEVSDGVHDFTPDSEYETLEDKVAKLYGLWGDRPRRTVGELLLAILERITMPMDSIENIAGLLMEWYEEELPLDEYGNPVRCRDRIRG